MVRGRVPGPGDLPPPIQKTSLPQGSVIRVRDSVKYRLPSVVTRMPRTSGPGIGGRLMLRIMFAGKSATATIRATSPATTSG